MTCNALGSLCSSICKSCSLSCGNKHNVIIIGGGELTEELAGIIANGTQGLREVVNQIQEQRDPMMLVKAKTMRRLHQEDRSIDARGIRQGIFETAHHLSSQLTLANEPPKRGWQKLRLAGASCNVSLETKYSDKVALTERELMELTKAIQKVSKYYLAATFFWRLGLERNFKASRIAMVEDVPKKSMKFLEKNLYSAEKKRLRDPEEFFDLDLNLQTIYLEAACLAPEKFRSMLLVQATLSAPLEALVKEPGSSKLRNRVLELGVSRPESHELKRTGSMESIITRRQHAKTASTGIIPEDSQLLKGSESPA